MPSSTKVTQKEKQLLTSQSTKPISSYFSTQVKNRGVSPTPKKVDLGNNKNPVNLVIPKSQKRKRECANRPSHIPTTQEVREAIDLIGQWLNYLKKHDYELYLVANRLRSKAIELLVLEKQN